MLLQSSRITFSDISLLLLLQSSRITFSDILLLLLLLLLLPLQDVVNTAIDTASWWFNTISSIVIEIVGL